MFNEEYGFFSSLSSYALTHSASVHNTSISCSTFLMFSGHQRGTPSYHTQPEINNLDLFITLQRFFTIA